MFMSFEKRSRVKVVTRTMRTMHNKDGVWNGVLTCVFVEVAGSYEKNFSVLGWCVVHQWCQNVLVRLTGGWNY